MFENTRARNTRYCSWQRSGHRVQGSSKLRRRNGCIKPFKIRFKMKPGWMDFTLFFLCLYDKKHINFFGSLSILFRSTNIT
ncbi:hypothetical protein RIR_jg9885.t1 [Rhizophagus irregularis DAOM 181602=DAOM 197198]|nr:hypothetical protein RIR_jg9885.t1 [Rhizophagus irregularis DAOM 181602=DAOM 197198]